MIMEDRIFCIHCNDILPKEAAGTVFRTGFYRASMRLGICTECTIRNGSKEMVDILDAASPVYYQEKNL